MSRENTSYGRYELKSSYQRNMAMAHLAVLCLVGLITGSLMVYGRLYREQTVTVVQRDIDRSVRIINLVWSETPQPVRRHVTVAKPQRPRDLGLHDKIQAAPDAPETVPLDSTSLYSDHPATDDGDTIQSYSDLIGGTGVGIYPPELLPTDDDEPLDIVPCSVLVAVSPEYPWVARERRKEGAAGIIVCIDETGRVSLFPNDIVRDFQERHLTVEKMSVKVDGQKRVFNYVVTYENPSGYYFAKKVAEKVAEWVFRPSTVDGCPVLSLLPIGHAFCMSEDCTFEYEGLRHYKRYSSVAAQ